MRNQRIHNRSQLGYTLLELVVSSATATVLIGGMASSILIASHALDLNSGSAATRSNNEQAINRMLRDVRHATRFSELTSNAITFTVADRDGDNQPETIRYAWSGSAGDPLTYSFNGATPISIVDDVQALNLTSNTRTLIAPNSATGDPSPIVLFVSGQSGDGDGGLAAATSNEQVLIGLIEGWGYDVNLINQQASSTEFDTALADAVAVYVSGQVNSGTLGSKVTSTNLGIVTESFNHAVELGFYNSSSPQYTSGDVDIWLTNSVHYITAGFTTGDFDVTTADAGFKWTFPVSSVASGALMLADADQALPYPTLLSIDAGDTLADGGSATGRRVQLPWGDNGFDSSLLNTDALTVMQRAIEWAEGNGSNLTGVVFEEYSEKKNPDGSELFTIVDTPTGTQEGDLLIAVVVSDGGQTMTPPAGWTEVSISTQANKVTCGVWWKLASSGESSTQTFTFSDYEQSYSWIMRFTGQDPVNPISEIKIRGGSSATPDSPGFTTSIDNSLVLRIGGFDEDEITDGDTGLTDHTEILMERNKVGNGTVSGGAGYMYQATAGNTGTDNFALTGSEEYVTVTLSIAPETEPK